MYSTRQSSHSYKVNYGVTPSSKSIIKAQWLAGRIYFLTPLFALSPSLLSWHLITFQCPVQLSVHTRPTLTFINHRQQIWHRGVTSPGAGDRGLRANQRQPFGWVTNERRGNTRPWLTMESSHYSRTQLNIVCLKKYESEHWIRIIKHQGGERQRPTLLFSPMKERERKNMNWL